MVKKMAVTHLIIFQSNYFRNRVMKTHPYSSNPRCRTVLDCKELRSELLEKYVFKYSYLVSPGYEQNFGSLIL